MCVFPQVHIEFTDGEERISLEGPTEEVEQAQAQIQEIIKDLVRRVKLQRAWIALRQLRLDKGFMSVINVCVCVCAAGEDGLH